MACQLILGATIAHPVSVASAAKHWWIAEQRDECPHVGRLLGVGHTHEQVKRIDHYELGKRDSKKHQEI
jgi:hypothetical protein